MIITPYHQDMIERLCHCYGRLVAEIPHCMATMPEMWQQALDAQPEPAGARPLQARTCLVALEGKELVGWVCFGLRPDGPPRDDGQLDLYQDGPLGTIGFFAYLPGHLDAGLALLRRAEDALLEQGARTIRAFHYDETPPFYHLEHAYLSSQLGHLHAALGLSGFNPTQGETTLAWHNMLPEPPAPPADLRLAPQWDDDDGRPTLILRAFDQHEEAGICVAQAAFRHAANDDARAWVYTPWLAVSPRWRRRGIARWLLLSALEIMAKRGFCHAAICCISDNYPALALYSNLGYRVTDQTQVWLKHLP